MGNYIKRGSFLDKKEMIARARELLAGFGMDVDPTLLLSELNVSYKQMTAIAKALLGSASLIIMDEPTTALTPAETDRLFAIMRSLREKGISIIFISHKLREVMEICDSYTVLRGGKAVSSGKTADVTVNKLASDMVGHGIAPETAPKAREYGETVLELEGLSDGKNFFDVSMSVRAGEILGVTGLSGDGRSEVFETVFGIRGRGYTGTVKINGQKRHPGSTWEAIEYGLAYLPKNRKENAIVPDMSVLDNGTLTTLKRYRRGGFIEAKKQQRDFSEQKERLHIKSDDMQALITALSGGNQQKTVLARWLLSSPRALILDNPTQGVDIGAREEIYSIIEELAGNGIAIIILSTEAQEIIRLCERCFVMVHGKTAACVSGDEMTEQNIMRLATGAERKTE